MSFFKKEKAAPSVVESNVVDLDEAEFEDSLHKNELVMVMFCRPECPHCIRMEPVYRELSMEMVDRVLFCRVNVMTNVALRKRYGITGTPTFVVLKRGGVVGTMTGEKTKELLKGELVRQL